MASLNGFLYAVGGHEFPSALTNSNRLECAERFDFKMDQWTLIAPMSKPKEAVGISALGSYLYIAGGYDGSRYLNDVEKYDPVKNEWTKVQLLNFARAGACLIEVNSSNQWIEALATYSNRNSMSRQSFLSAPSRLNSISSQTENLNCRQAGSEISDDNAFCDSF